VTGALCAAPGWRQRASYTELEFDAASDAGLPRLVFLLADTVRLPSMPADADRGAIERFRQRLSDAGLLVRFFTTDTGLELEVFHALRDLADRARPAAEPDQAARPALAAGVAVAHTLPADVATFTGRQRELDRLIAAIAGQPRQPGVIGISAIDGMAGAGKTALAVHAAHRLAEDFPDGQLFVRLHAHTPGHGCASPWRCTSESVPPARSEWPRSFAITAGEARRVQRWRSLACSLPRSPSPKPCRDSHRMTPP
jgi:hypothetical protein